MKFFKVVVSLSLVLLIISSVSFSSVGASSPHLQEDDVEEYLDTVVKELMEQSHIPNATISIVSEGEVVISKGYGYADLNERVQVDAEETLFRVGSISKLFTWTAVMQLVERELLDLETDVNEYIDFEIPATLEFVEETTKPEPITLKHLMSHTPGFEDSSSDLYRLSDDQTISLKDYVRENVPNRIFPAGEVIAYSNYGTALAGYIVEQVSGMPFAEYIDTHIYDVLGMENSTFHQPLQDDFAENMTKAYRYVDGEFQEGMFEFILEPAGSMSSTASDMTPFMLAYLQGGQYGGERILEENTVDEMFKPLFSHHQRLDGMAHGFIEGTFNERRTLFHTGSTMLFDAALYLLPEEQTGVFISHSGGNYNFNTEVFQALLDRYYPSNMEKSNMDTPLSSDDLLERSSAFVGEYQQNRRELTTSEKFLSLLMGVISVDVDEDGYLLVTHLGETNRFLEVEPGVYHNLREGSSQDPIGDFRTIVFGTDPLGKTLLMTDGPMSYSKAQWYETTAFNMMIIMLSLVFMIGSLLYWGMKAVIQKVRRNKSKGSKGSIAAKWLAIIYAFLLIIFVVEFMMTMQFHPVYQLPAVAYGEGPVWSGLFQWVPYMMVIIGVGMVIFTVFVWRNQYWRMAGRIHYTLLSVVTMLFFWVFSFWNFIG
ncbi:serine hydrolase domain-containing protein [Evansella tamaricis]|uniref:Beta-lactamase family protein n=1 Tax=Evansella tamaricis TaxID=2069301 RepID=A0ABS6JGF9_9BACI|nr:serine hydrolase [Evansella tamaricis]MBU9712299.1 beta-lactamase family protein [Evansella tamaricis]